MQLFHVQYVTLPLKKFDPIALWNYFSFWSWILVALMSKRIVTEKLNNNERWSLSRCSDWPGRTFSSQVYLRTLCRSEHHQLTCSWTIIDDEISCESWFLFSLTSPESIHVCTPVSRWLTSPSTYARLFLFVACWYLLFSYNLTVLTDVKLVYTTIIWVTGCNHTISATFFTGCPQTPMPVYNT